MISYFSVLSKFDLILLEYIRFILLFSSRHGWRVLICGVSYNVPRLNDDLHTDHNANQNLREIKLFLPLVNLRRVQIVAKPKRVLARSV